MDAADKRSETIAEQTFSDEDAVTQGLTDALNIVSFNKNTLIQGVVMSEILGHPRALKSRGNFVWNSRF